MPRADRDHEQVFIVRVPTFGDPDAEQQRTMVRLARATHHMVKPGCKLAAYDLGNGVRTTDWLVLDPFGDDMGNHEGHDEPLVPDQAEGDRCTAWGEFASDDETVAWLRRQGVTIAGPCRLPPDHQGRDHALERVPDAEG